MHQNTINLVTDIEQKGNFSPKQFKIYVYDQADTGRGGGGKKMSQY